MKPRALTFLLAAALIAVGGIAFAAKKQTSQKVTLCAAKPGGSVSVPKNGKCGRGKRKLTVSARGIEGKPGAAGSVGPAGATGAAGTVPNLAASPLKLAGEAGPDCQTAFVLCSGTDFYWANYGGGYSDVGYRTDANGVVYLQGVAKATTSNSYTDLGPVYLPPGLRPQNLLAFPARNCDTGDWARVYVDTDGSVTSNALTCVPLDGISFQP
ncbi:MAG: hypothetical protein J0H66_05065 [Solirubrobacterales bacterium]|nr:hypothetical protein [Solirubrobacterales bacterium]OJU95228.1 MAG: hypothetical protein BGO23_05020 [Solirubrobacterales bacterium 67-14]